MQIFVIDWQDVLVDSSDLPTYLAATYQPLLVSGTSIKTINGQSLLGAGNIAISVDLSGYLPIAGGTMAGNLDMDHYQISNVQAIDSDEITLNGLPVASEQYASNASNLSSGSVSDDRLSANVPRLNAASNAFSGAVTVPRISSPTSELPIFQSGADRANFSNGALTVTTFVGICASNPGAPDVFVRRNATGPTLETRAAGGLRVCNADGSALAALACSNIVVGTDTGVSRNTNGLVVSRASATITKTGDIGSELTVENPTVSSAGPMTGIRFVSPISSMPAKPSGRIISGFNANGYTFSYVSIQTVNGDNSFVDALTMENGSVAVGQASAAVKLDVAGTAATATIGVADILQLVRPTNPGQSWPQAARFSLGRYSTAGATTPRSRLDLKLADTNTGAVPEVTVMTWQGDGSVLIGATSGDGSRLFVSGNATVSGVAKFTGYPTSLLPAAASNAGGITYDTTLSKHVGCDGSTWNALW